MIPSVLAGQIRETLLDYMRTTFALSSPEFERALFDHLNGPSGLFKGPYVDVRLPFRAASARADVPLDIKPSFTPYAHQLRSFQRLSTRSGRTAKPTLVTTGTGSGKTECFLYPILDHCKRAESAPGVKAIILYPMNALATDQARRLARVLWDDPALKGQVTAGLYVGGQAGHAIADRDHLVDQREELRKAPPDILLTNYKMLDFLLLRPEDQKLWAFNAPDTLRYLVLDELHTYDGAQGSDVACLIRRLRARLGSSDRSICCVGTSATIGSDAAEAKQHLCDFARKVFGAPFPLSAVITEDRQNIEEALGYLVNLDHVPTPQDAAVLDPETATDPDAWIQRQIELWTGESGLDPVALGERLGRHVFLRKLLGALGGRQETAQELERLLRLRDGDFDALADSAKGALTSFLALVSHARRLDGDREVPFLTCQVQLWVRELRRLVQRLQVPDDGFVFAWADELDRQSEGRYLPIVYCRDCGAQGLGAVHRDGSNKLLDESTAVGTAYFEQWRGARYLQPGRGGDTLLWNFLHKDTLEVRTSGQHAADELTEKGYVLARIEDSVSDGTPRRFRARCPDCGADNGLSMMGSRAASLLSVALTHIFLSDYNRDKKLLAFTDSVQDASHRAGYFGARTYRFNLRSAFQGVLERADGPLRLDKLAPALTAQLVDGAADGASRARAIATLTPPDLVDLPEYQKFVETSGTGRHASLMTSLMKRLHFEAAMELGHRSQVGRTLERTGCATVAPDLEKVTQVAEALTADLHEEGDPNFSRLDADQVEHFLRGLLRRLRIRGGIADPLLRHYVKNGGNWFLLTKGKSPLTSPFSSRSVLPRFLVDTSEHKVFDPLYSRPTLDSWLRDWVSRSLRQPMRSESINDLTRLAIRRLVQAGALKTLPSGKANAFGLAPDGLLVTRDVAEVSCDQCQRAVLTPADQAARWAGRTCPVYRCAGSLSTGHRPKPTYYTRMFKAGRVQRIFPHEHTGLLERQVREQVEERFARGDDPGAPNVLVATPTLEMGVDVGDLSATMLCSVPPSTANYLQRIGRAGRKTGNALCLTMAVAQPHDQYFHAEPREMMSGEVRPPGCFLDATAMLERQLVAFAMDCWARDETELTAIPRKTGFCLSGAGKSKFPGRFLAFYAREGPAITQRFVALFGPWITDESAEALRAFGTSDAVHTAVQGAFDAVKSELEDLRRLRNRVQKKIAAMEAEPLWKENDDKVREHRELVDARNMVRKVMVELSEKYPLNVLTDEGRLPNYAFPEPGVTLYSVVSKGGRSDGRKPTLRNYDKHEYLRPASSAIRELAPFNTFYAEGRKVRVTEVDVGTKARPLTERWRVCEACHFTSREVEGEPIAAFCPRCEHGGWKDAGQLRTFVRFARARSFSREHESLTLDDADDRAMESYDVRDLIAVGPDNLMPAGASVNTALPFGYELLRGLTLTQLNAGRAGRGGGSKLRIAGTRLSADGFEVCMGCGRVNDPTDSRGLQHAPYCAYKKGDEPPVERVFLYRQVTSEAIRVLLPVSSEDVDASVASFKAALDLGFRRWFQGNPGHLLVKSVSEPLSGDPDLRMRFLVVYDGVPGGTGYLSELARTRKFMDVLQFAQDAMAGCGCREEEAKDGCYRCLYAFQSSRELKVISRRRAMAMLRPILEGRHQMTTEVSLSNVPLASKIESELERKFVRALISEAERLPDWEMAEIAHAGAAAWRMRAGDVTWRLEPQVDLGPAEMVARPCRPDFVLRPIAGKTDGLRPIAVFCDGLLYHACPDKAEGRVWDDFNKRQAILDSGRFRVWSVTWKDIDLHDGAKKPTSSPPSLFSPKPRQANAVLKTAGVTRSVDVFQQGSMTTLLEYLKGPDDTTWSAMVGGMLAAFVASPPYVEPSHCAATILKATEAPARFLVGPPKTTAKLPDRLGWLLSDEPLKWVVAGASCPVEAIRSKNFTETRVVIRLFDDADARKAVEFEPSWRAVLAAWNLLQFHTAGKVEVLSSEQLAGLTTPVPAGPPPPAAVADAPLTSEPNETFQELLTLADPACVPLIKAVRDAGLPLPEPGQPIIGGGRTLGEVELGWPDRKVAVVLAGDERAAEVARDGGWSVWMMPVSADVVMTALQGEAKV